MGILKNKKQILIILCIFAILVFVVIMYMTYMLKKIENNANNTIKTIVENDANNLKTKITEQKDILNSVANQIVTDNVIDEEKIFDIYDKSYIKSKFIRMAIMYENGKTITNDGFEVNYLDEKENFFSNNQINVFENRISKIDGEEINIYSKKINVNDNNIAILLIVTTESYKDIFSNKIFEGKGFSYIINNNSNIITSSNTDKKTSNMLEDIYKISTNKYKKEFETYRNSLSNSIKNNKSGEEIIETIYGKYYMVYENIGENNWLLATFIPSREIAKESNQALLTTFILSILVILVIISICIYIIISNYKKQLKLYEYAYIDPITKKGNIYYFRKKGQELLENFKTSNLYIAILDINKFKMINKLYGYKIGDEILYKIGEILEENLEKSSIISRYSNDYFSVLFNCNNDLHKQLEEIIEKIENMQIKNVDYKLSVNMGIYKVNKDKSITDIMDKAIIAHNESKGNVYNKYYIYDEKIEKELEIENEIEQSMNEALKEKEFAIYYQPKINIQKNILYGAEALVRWKHNGKNILPNEFIPIFEKNKFILKLDLYIFEQVCQDMKKWKEEYNKEFIIYINVSRQHFTEPNFLEKYVEITKKYGINPKNIDLEITESATIDSGINIIEMMKEIKKLGFLISIDDFGTGYSSLSMLQSMPIDILKIDKSFIDLIGKNRKNVVDYILNIAKELELKIIAEGVETKEQRDYLLERKCDIIQGYYYSKPLCKEEFEEYFRFTSF